MISKFANDIAAFLIVALMIERCQSICNPVNYLLASANRKKYTLKMIFKSQTLVIICYTMYLLQYWVVYFAENLSNLSIIPLFGPISELQRNCLKGYHFVDHAFEYREDIDGQYVVQAFDRIHLYVDIGQV